MLNVVVLGSTGSLGIQILEVLDEYSRYFSIIGLSANTQKKLLIQQAKKFKVKNFILASHDGEKAVEKLAAHEKADITINVLSGISGIRPSIAAIKAGKILILGNKESLFAEGKKIIKFSKNNHSKTPLLIPLDSEHNAIFEIIQKIYHEAGIKNLPLPKIKKIIIPCSGGPFYGKTKTQLKNVTTTQALRHPKWKMGKKISIESATLLNKGLEIVEAHYLFSLPFSKIEIRLHQECTIHGAVEFFRPESDKNSSRSTIKTSTIFHAQSKTYAYLSKPDMREYIENALFHAANQLAQTLKPNTRLSIPKFFKRNIRPLRARSAKTLKPLIPGSLSGIKIILASFKKFQNNPAKLKNFLLHEQKTIQQFLDGKIKFLEIFDLLR